MAFRKYLLPLSKSIRINTYIINFAFCCVWFEHWDKHRLKVSKTRALRLGFGPQIEEITGEWVWLYYGELNCL